MRKDTRFSRADRLSLEERLPPGTLSGPQEMGVWSMILQSDDPSEVCRWYRSYRDSDYCSVPREKLRAMRDTMIQSMREANRNETNPRKEKKKNKHYPDYENMWTPEDRKTA